MQDDLKSAIKIAVSSCLMGEAVRYDGNKKTNSIVTDQFAPYFNLISLCPEVSIGLGVPRNPIKMLEHHIGEQNFSIVDKDDLTLNYTKKMLSYINQQCINMKSICGYIIKERSPSCGLHETARFSANGSIVSHGAGFFTSRLMHELPWLPVISEDNLENRNQYDNFLERVYILHLWNVVYKHYQRYTEFNDRINHQIAIRGQSDIVSLGKNDEQYIIDIMTILMVPITVDMQVHFLKSQLEEYNIKSDTILIEIKRYKNNETSLWNIIQKFQVLFENERIVLKSNYFYPDEREMIARKHYFG